MNTSTQHSNWLRNSFGVAIVITLSIAAVGVAQAGPRHPRVNQVNARFENQQDRIAAGVKSGQLTAKETATLEFKESQLKNEERFFRTENNGHLTKGEQVLLNKQENQLSKEIYNQKHDAQVQNENPKSEVGKRLENQQDRIGQGIQSGQLTAGEAARLEAREVELRHEISIDRNANGGKLTDAEKVEINKELDGLSARIYKQKHDDQTQGH